MFSSPARRRIAILMHDLRGGGAERIMLRLASKFVARGLEVDLVLVRKSGDYLKLIPAQAKVIDLNKQSVMGAVPAIAAYLRSAKPAAMLAALTHVNVAAMMARALAPGCGTRMVLSERNQISRKASGAKGIRNKLPYLLAPYLYPRAALVTSVSDGVSRDLIDFTRMPAARVQTIYNPIAEPSMLAASQQACPHPWLIEKTKPVILAVGRLNEQKGFDTLVRAFARAGADIDARLIILGEGQERAKLEALVSELRVEDRVSMPGFAANPHSFMSKADLFVLSSRWEGLPGVLIEAMYCGAPVVATNCPSGPDEILDSGKYGLLVPVDDVKALATAMTTALLSPLQSATERAGAFEVDRAVDQYLAALGVDL